MKRYPRVLVTALLPMLGLAVTAVGQDDIAVALPEGVHAVWDASKAYRETTPTSERLCINGLWRWQPGATQDEQPPEKNWGYFKVPGCWPGITDYMQKDSQTLVAHPSWQRESLRSVGSAWYERNITIPADWEGRRIALAVDYLNSYAAVFIDGAKQGELRFPSGELDLTAGCHAGKTYRLSMLVVALPLRDVLLSFNDTNTPRRSRGRVARRGLCGDVFLVSTPAGPRIADVEVDTSVRRSEVTLDAALAGLAPEARYFLRARITQADRVVKEFTGEPFGMDDLHAGRIRIAEHWKPDDLWDLNTPQNKCEVTLSLLDATGTVVDTHFPVRFGYREFWIDGRDFYLNGSRIFLSAVPLDNAQIGAALATYAAARESLERLKSFGINFVYTHNYGCQPGSHLSFDEILRAADDVGMLVALSQPHFSHYDWKAADADESNGYAQHAAFYVRVAQNHPSVVAYATSHNATGYSEDMNPDLIDGIADPRERYARRNAELALRAEAIVKQLDPSRIVYHHSSGNLGAMYTINFYPNFVPIQELSDWFEHWATEGVKPVFTCEFGAPFTWDWTMYRGWYKGERAFGSAEVPWEFCLAEWNAQFFGDRAFAISEREAANLRWEAGRFRAGRLWHRWDYPNQVGSRDFAERYPVFAKYLSDNWPAFRTWGVSAISPWEYGHYWRLRDGVDRRRRRELEVDWENLQRPGFSPDYLGDQYERMDLAYERSDWVPTAAAQALERYNAPLLAYLAGKPDRFTSKDHVFFAGEVVEKQVIVVNNSRETVTCACDWLLGLPQPMAGRSMFTLPTGEQHRVPLRFALPATLLPGAYELHARVRFNNDAMQADSFRIHVVPRPKAAENSGTVALFDPNGETGRLLKQMGVACTPVDAAADLSSYDTLIVGKAALTVDGPAPDITRVRDGLRVLVFEQTGDVLEKRFGFRVAEYGLRNAFPRVPDHPALAGLATDHLRDWRGAATLLAARLDYTMRPRYGPTVEWCGIPVTRIWRCGNGGNVASVLIEKPVRGDFLPIVDGGYSLQYSPLMEYREGRGLVLFCQMDVTGRSETDPAAEILTRNLLEYVAQWRPRPSRTAVYAGEAGGRKHLEAMDIVLDDLDASRLSPEQVLIVGPGGGQVLAAHRTAIADWLKAGGNLLALGWNQQDADAVLPFEITVKQAEHIAAYFEPAGRDTLLAGIGPAEVHNRDPRELPLIADGAAAIGNGVLARAQSANVIFCQLVPWQFEPLEQSNLKRTFRRASLLVARLLANMGVAGSTPVLERFSTPVDPASSPGRWMEGLYLDQPEEWDDPYRFFRW